MASIGKNQNGRKRILFVAEDGSRKTIRLGKCSLRQAETFKIKLEALIAGRFSGIDADTARWLGNLPDDIYSKLAAVDLVQSRKAQQAVALGGFIRQYIESRVDLKPLSVKVLRQAEKSLVGYFGADKTLTDITRADAELWRLSMVQQGLAGPTIARRSAHAKQFLGRAVDDEKLAKNPFAALPSASKPNPSRMEFISPADIERVVAACPDSQWKAIFALARFGGLRCPSEVLSLQWQDINWERGRMLVRSPKTERHEGGESRVVPIFPELRPILLEAFEEAETGAKHVITRYRTQNANLRTHAHRIIRRAGLVPWGKIFQNLRSSRETELTETFPLHVVVKWLGNSQLIAAKHYLQVTDEHFEQAAQNAAQYPSVLGRTEPQAVSAVSPKNPSMLVPACTCGSMQDSPGGNHCLELSPLTTPKTPIPQSGRTESGTVDARNGTYDPDLAFIQDRWPDLPDWVKADILTTVKRYAKTPDAERRRTAVQDALRKAHEPQQDADG